MDTKLTLKLNASAIAKAKLYAAKHDTSLSAIVENYFDKLTARKKTIYLSEKLVGCVKGMQHLSDKEIKEMYVKDRYNA